MIWRDGGIWNFGTLFSCMITPHPSIYVMKALAAASDANTQDFARYKFDYPL